MNGLLLGILAYVVLQLVIGFVVSRSVKNENDYLLGGRSLGYPLAVFSIFATWFGAESCVGTAGAAYAEGLAGVRTDPFGYTLCLLVMGLFIAVPLYRLKLTTLADYFRVRFSPRVEKLTAVFLIPGSLFWAAAQIKAFGLILSSASSLKVETAIFLAAMVVIVYTVSGGLLADAWTDLLQGTILIIGLFFLIFSVFNHFGGISPTLAQIEPSRLNWLTHTDDNIIHQGLVFLETWLVPITGSLVAQELVSRVLASRNQVIAKRATLFAALCYLLIGLIPLCLGLIGFTLFPGLTEEEQILSVVARKFLPPSLYIVFTGALVSAILSTVDSALLACSALLSHNIIIPLWGNMRERTKLYLQRVTVVCMGIIAFILAIYGEGVYSLVEEASAFGTSGIFVAMILGLYSPLGNALSAKAAIITGAITWLVSHYLLGLDFSYVVSVICALLAYVMASRPNLSAKSPLYNTESLS